MTNFFIINQTIIMNIIRYSSSAEGVPQNPTHPYMLMGMILYLATVIVYLSFIPKEDIYFLCASALFLCLGFFVLLAVCLYYFTSEPMNTAGYSYAYSISLIPQYNINFSVGLNGFSLCLIVLTGYVMSSCIFALKESEVNYKAHLIYMYQIFFCLICCFCVTNMLFFFIFFESVLIPMFLLMNWGSQERKIKAATYLFFYTLTGSFFFLYGIYGVMGIVGSLDYEVVFNIVFPEDKQKALWWFFFLPFAMKIPVYPLHLWLPEAHVEASTTGSAILASLLLKLGLYGCLLFLICMLPQGTIFFQNYVLLLAAIGVIYASWATMFQQDLKRIIAYSSVAHMNAAVLGLFSLSRYGIEGAFFLMLGHGIVSAALFFCIGVLSDRHHTRLLKHYSGLVQVMPMFSLFFLFFTLGNMSFPGTSNFIGEFLIFVGVFRENTWIMILAGLSIVLSAAYSIWVFNRLFFGTLKTEKQNTTNYADLNRSEFFILFYYACGMFFFGLSSSYITMITYVPIDFIMQGF